MNSLDNHNSVSYSTRNEQISYLADGDTPVTAGGDTSVTAGGDTSVPAGGDTSVTADGDTSVPADGDTSAPSGGARLEFTIDEAIEKIGFGWFQIRLSVFAALVWMADAMEMMLLAVLAPAVQCLWSLSSYQEAVITTVVFLGMMLGSAPFGFISDRCL